VQDDLSSCGYTKGIKKMSETTEAGIAPCYWVEREVLLADKRISLYF